MYLSKDGLPNQMLQSFKAYTAMWQPIETADHSEATLTCQARCYARDKVIREMI